MAKWLDNMHTQACDSTSRIKLVWNLLGVIGRGWSNELYFILFFICRGMCCISPSLNDSVAWMLPCVSRVPLNWTECVRGGSLLLFLKGGRDADSHMHTLQPASVVSEEGKKSCQSWTWCYFSDLLRVHGEHSTPQPSQVCCGWSLLMLWRENKKSHFCGFV